MTSLQLVEAAKSPTMAEVAPIKPVVHSLLTPGVNIRGTPMTVATIAMIIIVRTEPSMIETREVATTVANAKTNSLQWALKKSTRNKKRSHSTSMPPRATTQAATPTRIKDWFPNLLPRGTSPGSWRSTTCPQRPIVTRRRKRGGAITADGKPS